jgi:DNA-binding winged helix-turn-helix (wHTH) protein/Tol biopolymer transport system component
MNLEAAPNLGAAPGPARLVRFDGFEADLRSGELRKGDARLKLSEQPFSVLAMLLARPGEVVSREELQKQLWPADTFVDFERGLNKAINRLREALADSASSPRYIETLPKRGYRFIAPLDPPGLPARVPEGPAVFVPPQTARAGFRAKGSSEQRRVLIAGGLIVALGLAAATLSLWRSSSSNRPESASPDPVLRSSLVPPGGMTFVPHSLALSRDGAHLAFVAEAANGSRSLWVRAMAATTATAITGTDGATFPFWSPDRQRIGFFSEGKLKVVDLTGGAIRVIADVRRPSGGSWNTDDVIVFAPDVNGPLYRVPATGGTPVPVSRTPDGPGLHGHRWPTFLPDDRHFLYVAFSAAAPTDIAPELHVGSLDTVESTQIRWEGARSVGYALGHLLYVRAGTLYAQPFDTTSLRTGGPPAPIAAAGLAGPPAFYPSALAVSPNGVLVFQSSADVPSRLVWLTERGQEQRDAHSLTYGWPAISPDGHRLAGSCEGLRRGTLAICVFDLERGVQSRITTGPNDRYPVWSRDGRAIAYSSGAGIYHSAADGSGTPQFVSRRNIPTGWLPDGSILSFGTRNGVVSMALSSPTTHDVVELGPGAEGQVSPDASWFAYIDQGQVVVERFPARAPRLIISSAGGGQPRWSRNGRQLFFISADKKLMAVDFDPRTVRAGVPRVLSQTRIIEAVFVGHQYDVAPDGRFVINAVTGDAAPLTLISGWRSLLTH